eukprot:TRINITY_DN21296_c1_g1_i2.p1 TRINITY_DN21296_c1_g1~~TRINITY_DN21296_c1_g1_i2.p1  ORF type:complete len:328 (+),score=105.18 TRINITY_DN21296_c1_g1_i2:186-1169(+)
MASRDAQLKGYHMNWMVYVSIVFLIISLILLIVALALPEWVVADVTTTPDDYLGHSDIDQDIGLFRSKTNVCCLGQWTFDTALNYCGNTRCNSNSGNTDDHVCAFTAALNTIRPVGFDCGKFRDGLYTTITFLFFVMVLIIAGVVTALLKLTTLVFPAVVLATALFAVIPIMVFPLVSYVEVKDFYQDRFPPVVAGYTYRNVYSLNVELGSGYIVLIFCFCCIVLALIFAAAGAWKARKDVRAAQKRIAAYTTDYPPARVRAVEYPVPAPPVVVRDDPVVTVLDEGQRANPIESMVYTKPPPRHPSPLTRNNVEYNDFVHRVDGTFA